jgi:hypothetical protein
MYKFSVTALTFVALLLGTTSLYADCTSAQVATAVVADLNQHGGGTMFKIVEVSTPTYADPDTNWTAVTIVESLQGSPTRSALVSFVDPNRCDVWKVRTVALSPYQN